jgi:hypothetical protein
MAKDAPKIAHVAWRDGRPRFAPSTTLRAQGYKGEDLKNEKTGKWMTAGEALDWSRNFSRRLETERRKEKLKAGVPREKVINVPVAVSVIRQQYPVSLLFDQFLHAQTNPRFGDLAEKTQTDYRQKSRIIQKHAPDIWQAEAEALTKPICLGLYDTLRTKAGNTSAVGAMTILGVALQWAMDRGRLASMLINPAHKLKMKTPEPRLRIATREELSVLIDTADALGWPEMGDMFTLAVWSGQRQADRLQFTTKGRERGRLIIQQNKTKAIVSMTEANELKKRLDAATKRRTEAGVISPYIILNERTWKPFVADYYRRRFEEVRRHAKKKLPTLADLTDADFRDTSVTWLAMAGCTIPEICAITGHSLKTAHDILKHYLALNQDMADAAITKLANWFDKEKLADDAHHG